MTNIEFTFSEPTPVTEITLTKDQILAVCLPLQALLVSPIRSLKVTLACEEFFPDYYNLVLELTSLLDARIHLCSIESDTYHASDWVDLTAYFPALPYQIYSSWHVSDVQTQAPILTDDEASQVLERLKTKHDAEIGLNWDSIDATIDVLFSDIRDCTRLDRMPQVTLTGYYKGEPHRIYEGVHALIGTYPEYPTEAEELQDENVMYYFESIEELKVGFEIDAFVVTSWEISDAAVPTT